MELSPGRLGGRREHLAEILAKGRIDVRWGGMQRDGGGVCEGRAGRGRGRAWEE